MGKLTDAQMARRKLVSERHKARHFAVQALYQWQLTAASAANIEAQFRAQYDMKGADLVYFRALLCGVQGDAGAFDTLLTPFFEDRALSECDPITLSLLRLATYELRERVDVPYKVVINEAVNLAKKFGPEDSHKFINGVLDKAARQLRRVELDAEEK